MRRGILCATLLYLGLAATPVAAQEPRGPTAGSVAGALLGGAAGLVAGGLLGSSLTSGDCEAGNPDQCLGEAIPGFLWGAGAGMTLGVPIGAHVGNGRRGDLVRSLLVSGGLFAAEVLVLSLLVDDGRRTDHVGATRAVAVSVPILQILSSVIVEGRTDGR